VATCLEGALRLVGDKYSLQIIHLLLKNEAQRFVELENAVQGISPRTLSARLKHLEFQGLITRKAYPTIPPKVEYRATEKGQALGTSIQHLASWFQDAQA
jgi:DNA-binding HxlR family transcriptional regulator